MPDSVPPPFVLARIPRTPREDERLAALVDRALASDVPAWQDLCLTIAAVAWGVTGSHLLPERLRRSKDDRLQVAVRVMGALHDDDFSVLRNLREAGGVASLRAWLVTLCHNAAVDHVRENAGRIGRAEGAPTIVDLEESAGELRAPDSRTGREIEARHIADVHVPALPPSQAEALGRWLRGEPEERGSAEAAEERRLVNAALKVLCGRVTDPGAVTRRTGKRRKGRVA
jgi:hypothetical protein